MKRKVMTLRELYISLITLPGHYGVKIHQESHSSLWVNINNKFQIIPSEEKTIAMTLVDTFEINRSKGIFWTNPVTSYIEYRRLVGTYVNNETIYLVFSDE